MSYYNKSKGSLPDGEGFRDYRHARIAYKGDMTPIEHRIEHIMRKIMNRLPVTLVDYEEYYDTDRYPYEYTELDADPYLMDYSRRAKIKEYQKIYEYFFYMLQEVNEQEAKKNDYTITEKEERQGKLYSLYYHEASDAMRRRLRNTKNQERLLLSQHSET